MESPTRKFQIDRLAGQRRKNPHRTVFIELDLTGGRELPAARVGANRLQMNICKHRRIQLDVVGNLCFRRTRGLCRTRSVACLALTTGGG